MSMNNYAISGLGLILNNKETDELVKTITEVEGLKEHDIEPYELGNYIEGAEWFDEETDGKTIYNYNDNLSLDYPKFNIKEDLLVIWAHKQPNPFKVAYSSMDELIKEFENKVGKYLPKDFNYKEHIGIFEGSIFE